MKFGAWGISKRSLDSLGAESTPYDRCAMNPFSPRVRKPQVNLPPMSIGLLGRLADEVSYPEKSVARRTGPARVHAWPYQVELGPE